MKRHSDPVICSAIVVTADSGPCLRACVDELLASDDITELLLIDNASTDGIPEAVALDKRDDPRLRMLQNKRNVGFGAAVNRAAHEVSGAWLVIVNPDCVVPPKDLSRLLHLARTEPDVGMLGALVQDPDGQIEPASRRRDPLLRRVLADFGLMHGKGVCVRDPTRRQAQDVEAISGALMLIPRRVFEQLGGFDEGYFLHFEDLDLCRRVRDAGHRVVLAGGVSVVHAQGSSSHHRPVFVAWQKHRSMWRWLRKFDPAAKSPWRGPLVWIAIWFHFIVSLPVWIWRSLRQPSSNASA